MFAHDFTDKFRARRTAYAARRQLVRELSSYSSQNDIDDLEAVLDRYPDHEVAPIRAILQRQRAA